MKQKLLFLFSFLLAAVCSHAATTVTVDGMVYSLSDTTATVASQSKNNALADVIIPDHIEYEGKSYYVTSITTSAFSGCTALTSISIPGSVTSIGNAAFSGCTALNNIIFEDGEEPLSLGVNSSSQGLFYDCPIKSLYLGRTISYITSDRYHTSPFNNKSELSSITIGNNVSSIDRDAFYGCSALTSISIPSSVTSIGNYAFSGCTALNNVIFEDGEEPLSLGFNSSTQGLFYDCPLETLHIGRSISYPTYATVYITYGYSPFYNKKTIKNITFGKYFKDIPSYAFSGCSNIESLILPDSLATLGSNAFYGCSSLSSIDIPNSATFTSIGELAFGGCSALTSISIPSSVTSIGNKAFYHCTALTSISIPSSVTSIGESAFYDCSSLKTVIIEDSETTLDMYRKVSGFGSYFYNCPIEYLYIGRNII
ncbi:leucine-rich repeat domain-containing protein [Bacteroides caecimuris]|uniref:leucine-rich repeat domain-containing protein n=1 Tax=Bacteroides caecimuris TaxID=1796613 RepID=UPI0026488849|nr:leucine-rich repeat domain-containing protein [Bacteroides caecimuris]